ncbi:glutathione S-transferase N-terminal domain-containing protein [Pseudomonas petrae]|uniref:Glutathione S-transferase N-terminal domain-containing protein n=1 Tax=Pseudomonas petrae TaxID=2912190 RepID=A0ABS9I922_9PSED|nr:glutathione S-transferase N-terminal domain-containing protein [Pseudomonas petrae]MCF7530965.1 glutathione S-transferase N-terminal domain-containing protein [Pseudomonas petrae]MCF7536639.1 glutathione S-transferase N-terminal domain-containing protein [Pseudomonas petrae]MCF7544250.1 glutathione S-transferase N-terminal domain-containing protein [Pseudomonas petrae]MCF7554319.1 glutathione S-transferase N-terminal domain-containing protein [Pseudomonas petrae]
MTTLCGTVDYYYWPTPNGQKVAIFLEETGQPYIAHPVNISKGEQFSLAFTRISPNQRIPALVDSEADVSLFESGAILLYLAQRYGQFIPLDNKGAAGVTQWLFWQAANLGPILGQTVYFLNYAPEQVPLPIERFTKETQRLYGVLEQQLADHPYVAGEYSIADMAIFPWVLQHDKQGMVLDEYPNVAAWLRKISERPAVVRAYVKGEEMRPSNQTDEDRKKLYTLG